MIFHLLLYIHDETCNTLVQVLIISRLDYDNALLRVIFLSLKNCLERVEDCAARLVIHTRKMEYITPILFQLHWPSVHIRSLYMFHTLQVLSGTAPLYQSDLIRKYLPVKMLRSESYSPLLFTKSYTVTYGDKSFRASAPSLWNMLPKHIQL